MDRAPKQIRDLDTDENLRDQIGKPTIFIKYHIIFERKIISRDLKKKIPETTQFVFVIRYMA